VKNAIGLTVAERVDFSEVVEQALHKPWLKPSIQN
jgi:hypothetical protein